MGMYDTIKCLYPLPLPSILDVMGELKDRNFCEFDYQTKDLDNCLDHYEIRADGTLWHELYDIEDKSDPNATGVRRWAGLGLCTKTNIHWIQMADYSGVITFYTGVDDDSYVSDYWIEYDAVFSNGKLLGIKLIKFESTPNAARKALSAAFNEKIKQRQILWDRWYMKYGYAYYDRLVATVFCHWRKLKSNKMIPCSYEVEKWMRPL